MSIKILTFGLHRTPALARRIPDFHSRSKNSEGPFVALSLALIREIPQRIALHLQVAKHPCTKSCHRPVNGMHSIEKADTYRSGFSIDEKNRRSKTRSFFDSFLSFSGWCGVPGLELSHLLTARQEGGQARVYSKALVEENGKTKSKAR